MRGPSTSRDLEPRSSPRASGFGRGCSRVARCGNYRGPSCAHLCWAAWARRGAARRRPARAVGTGRGAAGSQRLRQEHLAADRERAARTIHGSGAAGGRAAQYGPQAPRHRLVGAAGRAAAMAHSPGEYDLPRRLAHRGELGAALAMLRRVWLESSAWWANPPPSMSFPFIIPAPSMSCAPTAAGSAARSKPTAAGPVAFPRARERYRPRCW